MFLPSVIEDSGRGLKSYDIPSKLFEQNIITLFGEVNDETAYAVTTQLLYLDSLEKCEEINLYINSGGGSVYSGNAIISVMNHIKTPVNTVCLGMIASMGTQIFASGTGERRALPNTRIMIHSVSSGSKGDYHTLKVDFYETEYLQEKLMRELADCTKGKSSYDDIVLLTQRDKYLSPEEAIEIGIVDTIVISEKGK